MKSPFFSIIIPVYNGANNFLSECLNSIWNQPLENSMYEVLCIDDCSTDDTIYWLEEQASIHCNLKIIKHTENKRQGGARNTGINYSSGKYLIFIDQDDYFHEKSLFYVYEKLINSNIEVLVVDFAYHYRNLVNNNIFHNSPNHEILTGKEYIIKNSIVCAPWRFVINANFYKKLDISFVEKCRIEDIDWSLKLMFYATKVQYSPIILLHYIKGETSTTDNMYKDFNSLTDLLNAANRTKYLAYSLYKNDPVKINIIDASNNMYNQVCKYLLFCKAPIKDKVLLIDSIKGYCNLKFVKFARAFPYFYSFIGNIISPLLIWVRKIHRKNVSVRLYKRKNKI